MKIDLDLVPYSPPDLHLERFGDETLVLDPRRLIWAFVNDLGVEILKLCGKNNSIKDISRNISEKYSTDITEVQGDVINFVEDLKGIGLLGFEDTVRHELNFRNHNVIPEDLFLEITNKCNLRCLHCYLAAEEPREDELSLKEIKDLIDDLKESGGKRITISGGEPLTRPDWLDIVRYAKSRGLDVKLLTNGTLITDEVAKIIKELGLFVQISLESPSRTSNDRIRGPGSYDRILRGLNNLIELGHNDKIAISMTINKWNIYEVDDIIDFLIGKKVKSLHFSTLANQGRAAENWIDLPPSREQYNDFFREWFQKYVKIKDSLSVSGCFTDLITKALERKTIYRLSPTGCSFGYTYRVDSRGDVYPCEIFVDPEYSLGNITDISLSDIIGSKMNNKLRKMSYYRRYEIEKCENCEWRNACGGGCMARSLTINGTLYSPDDFCEVRQILFRKIFQDLLDKSRAGDGKANAIA